MSEVTPHRSVDRLAAIDAPPSPPARTRPTHPQGWEPGISWDGAAGTVTAEADAGPDADPALWAEIVRDWGINPATTEIVDGSAQLRAYDAPIGNGETKRVKYYRVSVRARRSATDAADIEAIKRTVTRRKPKRTPAPSARRASLVVALSDWQIGKGEGGGTARTVDQIVSAREALVEHVCTVGPLESVVLLGLGDLVEHCSGHYASQAFSTDLDEREQLRVARRLILSFVDAVLGVAPHVVLGAVPGNHGERRQNGKAYTRSTDNDDLAVVEQVAEIMAANPDRYGDVSTVLADGLTLTLDVSGVVLGATHMHQATGGGGPEGKAARWWSGQALGRTPIGDADMLLSGHYHHLHVSESTGRTWMQAPAIDPGSKYWTEATGQASPPGMLTVVVGADCGRRGWERLEVLG